MADIEMGAMEYALLLFCIAFVGFSSFVLGGIAESNPAETPEWPDRETNVTCYKWVENGTAHVSCPSKVYAPESVVNITVKHCSDYEYRIDEQPPCERS